tara:strand:- start:652 stop:1362 length:711 start_codon:yes stop_codon:yes gene_type:complete
MNYLYAAEKITMGHGSTWDAIMSASPVVQLTLLSLVIMSVVCWAIVFHKRKEYRKVAESNRRFLEFFWDAASFEEVARRLRDHKDSPLCEVFESGYNELLKIVDSSQQEAKFAVSQLDNIARVMRNASDVEMNRLENRLSFLATTGATGPFIGLFGTVWGIMNAFQKIGATGSASLAVVAPGISEALVATAVGLLAAIPAVIFYNHFNNQLERVEMDFSQFQADFLNIVRRNFVVD